MDTTLPVPPAGSSPTGPVRQLLYLATAHLPPELGGDQLDRTPGVVLAHRLDPGWLLCVPDHGDPHPHTPAEITTICEYAHTRGCTHVLLQPDGDRVDDLPTWDWP